MTDDDDTTQLDAPEDDRKAPGGDHDKLAFPVVAVGASAGGLEAFTELLGAIRDGGPELAFVFVQHLDPRHESQLAEILPRSTSMEVVEAKDGMQLAPHRIHVIPPDCELAIMHGVLRLMPRTSGRHLPVDYFMRSLAEDQGGGVVGVILSGTGSDGAAGIKAIKAAGGITMAQSEDDARYSGMPRSAIDTGQVDIVLPAKGLAEELARIVGHPRLRLRHPPAPQVESASRTQDAMQKIFFLLRRATGVDFSQYKQSTVERRIGRRLVLYRLESPEQYLRYLHQNPSELHALFDDMLINVTGFFREPETFEALKDKVLPELVRDRDLDMPIRVWVPACSTGEEAYSIAMVLLEHLGEQHIQLPIQIFATDISDTSIERARAGRYPASITTELSPERLRRFFVKTGDGYQISKSLRDLCVFARQNVLKDPPFSNLDLVSCRNFLIYLGPALQKRVIPIFHYALRSKGYLLLGRSETIGSSADLFALLDRDNKIYAKKESLTRLPATVRANDLVTAAPVPVLVAEGVSPERPVEGRDLEREADDLVLAAYGPPGVIINRDMEILQFRGRTGRFLEPAPGSASLNLLRMARPSLGLDLRAMAHECRKTGSVVRKEDAIFDLDAREQRVTIEVHPLGRPDSADQHFLVLFRAQPDKPAGEEGGEGDGADAGGADEHDRVELDRFGQELERTRATLQSIIEEHESTNEELRAANEEIQSANEELQSTNEELETAKEELQSTNEELITLNGELENQNAEANRAIDDFTNLYSSVDIPVILLDQDLRIRAFTPPTARQLGIRHSDQGRRIGELKLGIRFDGIEDEIRNVLSTLNTCVREVESERGQWYSLRIRPYRTTDDRITGAVIVLVDVTASRSAREATRGVMVVLERLVERAAEPFVVIDGNQHVLYHSRGLRELLGLPAGSGRGKHLRELGHGAFADVTLHRAIEERTSPGRSAEAAARIATELGELGSYDVRVESFRLGPAAEETLIILMLDKAT